MDVEAATHKRDPIFGFTYDQKPLPDEKRRHIPLQGQKVRTVLVVNLICVHLF
jgi:hypothetical protein